MTAYRRAKLAVIGHTGIDYIIDINEFGEKDTSTQISSIKEYMGGTGMNVAMSAAKNGLDVSFFTCVPKGFDFGEEFRREVSIISSFHHEEFGEPEIPRCFIINNWNKEQKAYIHDDTLKHYNTIKKHPIAEDKEAIHFTTTPPEYTIKTAKYTQDNTDAIVSWSPGQNIRLWNYFEFREMIVNTNILFVNNTEMNFILNEFGVNEEDILEMMNKSHDRIVIRTMGKYGSLLISNKIDGSYEIPAVTVEDFIDATGCGDAFTGAFLARLLQNNTFEYCLRYASTWASYIAEAEGCQTNYHNSWDVDKKMEEFYEKR